MVCTYIRLRGIGSIAMTGSAARDRIFGALILALGIPVHLDVWPFL
jgi:hypothetical protein